MEKLGMRCFQQALSPRGVARQAFQHFTSQVMDEAPPKVKPEMSSDAQQQQQRTDGGVPPAKPTGTLQDLDPTELLRKRNQILWEQAQRGEQPGLMLMQDALSGEKRAQTWGNEPSILEPEQQN